MPILGQWLPNVALSTPTHCKPIYQLPTLAQRMHADWEKGVKLGVFTYLAVESLLFMVLRWGLFYFIANKIAHL